ncbi:MAG TPA: hypothetical protein VGJ90_04795 [Methylophilaceae bacterium]|jgi:hypothetical protein
MINTTNTDSVTPTLMGQSAKNVRVEAKSGMLARLESPTGQKKNKPQAIVSIVAWWPIILLISLVAIVITVTILYFTLEPNPAVEDSNLPIFTLDNQIKADSMSNQNQSKQIATLTNNGKTLPNQVVLEPKTEPAAATILSESEAKKNSPSTPAHTHDTLSKPLIAESSPSVVDEKQTQTASATQASPFARLQVGASPIKTSTSNKMATNKQDPDVKVIDALVTSKPENSSDRDVKVLTALVLADKMAKSGAEPHSELEKVLSKPQAHPTKSNMAPPSATQAKPMVLGNAGETVADKLAQCSTLSFVEAPVCRIRVCFGNVGTAPECTPDFKKPEVNVDEISPIKGH